MTEYWQSQARKYCEFCKCWLADNKVSISFHENGKRHKENVKKHISTLSKKSAKEHKKKEKIDGEMQKMEAAAMAAYLKDVRNNADLTSQSINEMLGYSTTPNDSIASSSNVPKKELVWQEVKNESGSSYFWNTETNETKWDPPDEYISLVQQEEKKIKEQELERKKKEKEIEVNKQKQEEAIKEAEAFMMREKMKELATPKEKQQPVKLTCFGPEPRAVKPYGSWTPVVSQPVKKIDLQLPKVKEPSPPPVVMEPERFHFTEKRVTSLGDGPVEFKKRKVGNQKRNMRQKLDDD